MAISLDEVLTHIEGTHINPNNKNIWNCKRCDFECNTVDNLTNHIQVQHKLVKVEIKLTDQIEMQCDQCAYKCLLKIQIKKHKKSEHEQRKNSIQM